MKSNYEIIGDPNVCIFILSVITIYFMMKAYEQNAIWVESNMKNLIVLLQKHEISGLITSSAPPEFLKLALEKENMFLMVLNFFF